MVIKVLYVWLRILFSALLFFSLASLTGLAIAADQGDFGQEQPIPFSLSGDIYFVPPGTHRLPDFSKLESVGRIYATELNIPKRAFKEGFPGVTDRVEWFAIDYNGTFLVEKTGRLRFQLTSDDGSKLFIDDEMVIDNDGVHAARIRDAARILKRGVHKIRVQYFQGPRYEVALILMIAGPVGDFKPFSTVELASVKVIEDKEEVRIVMDAALLFAFNKHHLSDYARVALTEIKTLILDAYPDMPIIIEGHTDSVGSDDYNIDLSVRRVQTVVDVLLRKGVDPGRMEAFGYGESSPKFTNKTSEGRAKNRRVEIRVKKTSQERFLDSSDE